MQVTKKSGELEDFRAEKIVEGCKKAGASEEVGKKVADEVSKRVTDKMATKEIKEMVIGELRKLDENAAKAYEEYRSLEEHESP